MASCTVNRLLALALALAVWGMRTAAGGPRLEFTPDKIDFGIQPKGPQLAGTFQLRNAGDETLRVLRGAINDDQRLCTA